jgi:hypothetical protein
MEGEARVTTSIAEEVVSRKRSAPEARTLSDDFLADLREQLDAAVRIRFPSDVYKGDPVKFCRDILGVEPWHKQVEILEAVRDFDRVAVVSGHKIGKSMSAAMVALWFYCSYRDARVVMTSTTSRQVDQILWRELKMLRARGSRCVDCKREDPDQHRILRPCPHSTLIEGDIGELARTGLKSTDFREIVGFTAREAEAVAGISGSNLLYVADEASGIPEEIFEAMEGNRAGGARIAMFSNGTRNKGEFFEAFHSKAKYYKTIQVSCEESPNVVEGRNVIPGLATRDWVELKKEEWGEHSPMYIVRVKGGFALHEDGKIFSIHAIGEAEKRWHEAPEQGRLFIGLDPAGESGSGDETVYAIRRGLKVLRLVAHLGLSEEAHVVHLLSLIKTHKLPRETPVAVVDREGSVGSKVAIALRNYADAHPGTFELVTVRASDRAVRQPAVYDRLRDELTANLEAWMRDGGAIPEDAKLALELHQPEWIQNVNGRVKVTPKTEIRKAIGRSPDRYDAVALSAWEPLSLKEGAPPPPATDVHGAPPSSSMDPYAGSDAWR